jgi:glutathione S-transferase
MHRALKDCASLDASSEIAAPGTEVNSIFRVAAEDVAIKCTAQIVGEVDCREGDGILLKIPMGKVEIEMTSEDITFSWVEGNFHSVAAMPFANFCRYVMELSSYR